MASEKLESWELLPQPEAQPDRVGRRLQPEPATATNIARPMS